MIASSSVHHLQETLTTPIIVYVLERNIGYFGRFHRYKKYLNFNVPRLKNPSKWFEEASFWMGLSDSMYCPHYRLLTEKCQSMCHAILLRTHKDLTENKLLLLKDNLGLEIKSEVEA